MSETVAEQSGKNLMVGIKLKLRLGAEFGSVGPLKVSQPLINKCSNSRE